MPSRRSPSQREKAFRIDRVLGLFGGSHAGRVTNATPATVTTPSVPAPVPATTAASGSVLGCGEVAITFATTFTSGTNAYADTITIDTFAGDLAMGVGVDGSGNPVLQYAVGDAPGIYVVEFTTSPQVSAGTAGAADLHDLSYGDGSIGLHAVGFGGIGRNIRGEGTGWFLRTSQHQGRPGFGMFCSAGAVATYSPGVMYVDVIRLAVP